MYLNYNKSSLKLRTISELIGNTFAFMSWWHIFLVSPPKNLKSIRVFKKKNLSTKTLIYQFFKNQHTLFSEFLREKKYDQVPSHNLFY